MMKMRVNFLLSAVLILHCASAASQDKWAGLAKTIDAKCTNECAGYMEQAKAGVMRAHHEAAACKTGCYYNNLPEFHALLTNTLYLIAELHDQIYCPMS